MKNRTVLLMLISILIILTFELVSCTTEMENNSSSDNSLSESSSTDLLSYLQPDNTAIRWGMPAGYHISDRALAELNKALIDRGYDFHLEIVLSETIDYYSEFPQLVDKYMLDISTTGFANNNSPYKLIQAGYFTPLDEYLDQSDSAELRSLFDEKMWDSMRVDDTTYTIPNGKPLAKDVLLINKEYINEADLQDFTGDIAELKPILEKIPVKEGFTHIIYNELGFNFYRKLRCDDICGTWLPYDGSGAYNPLELDSFRNYIKTFHDFYSSGYIGYNVSFATSMGELESTFVNNALQQGNFAVYFASSVSDFSKISADYFTIELDYQLTSNLGLTTGIVSSSAHKDQAFELLKLAYTDQQFADLLIYGAEEVDYSLIDGRVAALNGGPFNAGLNPHWIGIYESATPVLGEKVTIDRCTDKLNYFREKVIASPYLGKHFDTTGYEEIIAAVDAVLAENYDLWKAEDIEVEMDRVSQLLVEAGINELTAAINEQFGIE